MSSHLNLAEILKEILKDEREFDVINLNRIDKFTCIKLLHYFSTMTAQLDFAVNHFVTIDIACYDVFPFRKM